MILKSSLDNYTYVYIMIPYTDICYKQMGEVGCKMLEK